MRPPRPIPITRCTPRFSHSYLHKSGHHCSCSSGTIAPSYHRTTNLIASIMRLNVTCSIKNIKNIRPSRETPRNNSGYCRGTPTPPRPPTRNPLNLFSTTGPLPTYLPCRRAVCLLSDLNGSTRGIRTSTENTTRGYYRNDAT